MKTIKTEFRKQVKVKISIQVIKLHFLIILYLNFRLSVAQ